jgi:hypothetical protein
MGWFFWSSSRRKEGDDASPKLPSDSATVSVPSAPSAQQEIIDTSKQSQRPRPLVPQQEDVHNAFPNNTALLPSTLGLSDNRARRQLTLFLAGGVFLGLSIRVGRKAVLKRIHSMRPTFYAPNMPQPVQTFNGPLEAAEALYIATLNVGAFAMMMMGGTAWAFDIGSLQEMRWTLRERLYGDPTGKVLESKEEVKEETGEWIKDVLIHEEKLKAAKGKEKT